MDGSASAMDGPLSPISKPLSSVRESCTPRSEVLQGGLVDKHFAAQLDQVIANAPGYHDYADADSFFKITHPTRGLKDLLAGTFARLSHNASAAASAEHAVYRYETSFGGGKTHGLIALWHLARGARPPNLNEFIDPALLPLRCSAAAVVGDSLDPVNGLTTDGTTTYTLWGEIGRQLGPEAWALIQASDEARTAPGKQVWLDMFGATPTVIVIDEIAQYLRQLASSARPDINQMAKATIASLKVLFEAATAAPAVRIIVTLATGTAAFGPETTEIAQTLNDVAAEQLIAEANDVMERPKGAIGRPAEDHEIGFILRRRLFSEVNEAAAATTAAAYQEFYRNMAQRGVAIGAATADPAAYAERITSTYPFHPALIDCLDKRIGPMPGFQRARGALKMLAEAVAALWTDGTDAPTINLGDLPLHHAHVRASITTSIDRDALDGPAVADFAAPNSHAYGVDKERWPDQRIATRACATVFCHSVAGEPLPGAAPPDIYAGTCWPGDDPDVIEEALASTSRVAWHLVSDGASWRFQTAPNANRIIASEMTNVANADITEELDGRIRSIFPSDGPVKAIHFPTGPADVPDEQHLRLVVFSHLDVTTTAHNAHTPPEKVANVANRFGIKEQNRTYRNAMVALVADEDAIDAMRERVAFELAARRVTSDADRMARFDSDVANTLKQLADKAVLETRVAIGTAYRHLYWPARDPANQNLRHYDLPARDQGKVPTNQTSVIIEALRSNGKIKDTAPPTDRLAAAVGFSPSHPEITTAQLAEAPWRDHAQAMVLNPSLITEAIATGVRSGAWVYYDPDQNRAWVLGDPAPPARINSNVWLYTESRAQELGLLRRPIDQPAINTALATNGGSIDGAALRRALHKALGGEPAKTEMLEGLARAARSQQCVVMLAGESTPPPPGSQEPTRSPLDADEILGAELDSLLILTPERAAEEGVSSPQSEPSGPIIVRRSGDTVGKAFRKIEDALGDRGGGPVAGLTVIAAADAGESPRDLRALGYCVSQLPRFDCRVTANIVVEYDGLDGSLSADLAGAATGWRQVEDALLGLADRGSAVGGTLTLEFTPAVPIPYGGPDWDQFRSVVTNNDPGAIEITVTLADGDSR